MVVDPKGQPVSEPAGADIYIHVGSMLGAFLVFTGICVVSLIFGLTMLPEMKNRTLEEIAASWTRAK